MGSVRYLCRPVVALVFGVFWFLRRLLAPGFEMGRAETRAVSDATAVLKRRVGE